jgi:hypothetical protein
MCEEKGYKHHGMSYRHHRGYTSIVKRLEKDVVVPEVLLEVADINEGDFLEISVRKVKKHRHHHE